MTIHRIAPLALFAACMPATAWGQACPTNDRRGANSEVPMLPTVVSYAVTRTTGPANERERESHEVTVIGGDATEGDVRIDMRLSAEVASNCPLSVDIFDPALSVERRTRGEAGAVSRVLQRASIVAQPRYSDGSNRLVLFLGTLATLGNRIDTLAFTIGSSVSNVPTPSYSFTLQRRPIDMVLTSSATSGTGGTDVTLTATLPGSLDSHAFEAPVQFTVEPAAAGTFRRPGASAASARGEVDVNFAMSPPRAQVIFEPAQLATPLAATISARVAGGVKSVPFTVLRGPAGCRPVAEYKRVPDGIELTITNAGELPCPSFRAEMRKGPSTLLDTEGVPVIAPTPQQVFKPGAPLLDTRLRQSLASPVTTSPPLPTSWTGLFRINTVTLPVGTILGTKLIANNGSILPVELAPFTVPVTRGIIPIRN
jgi:hypothetical protein